MDTVDLVCALLFSGLVLYFLAAALRKKAGLSAPAEAARPGDKLKTAVLWALLLALCSLRFYRFGAVPGGFNQDGAMAAVDALALANHGTDRLGMRLPAHFTAWGYGQMSVLLSYCMAPLFKLFGMSSLTARLPLLLVSFLGMGAAYGLLRGTVSRRAALIGLLLLAVNPWHFMQSRWALDCNMLPHLFLMGIFLLWLGVKKPSALYGSMVFFALCMYSYGLAFVSVPLFLLGGCALLLAGKWIRPRQALLCAGIYFLLSFPIYGTMLINALGLETVELPFVTMPFFPQSVRSGDLIFFSPEPWKQLASNARSLWQVGFLQGHDLPWNAIDGFGTLYRCSWPLMLLGLGLAIRRAVGEKEPRRRLGYRLLLLFWLCALATGLCAENVNVNRLNVLFYSHVLFLCLGVHGLISFRRWTAVPLLLAYGLLSVLFFLNYFGPWAQRIRVDFYEDFLQAVDYAGEADFDALVITPDVQYSGGWQVSEILTRYQLQLDAEYCRGETGDPVPYRQRFQYRNFSEAELAAPPSGTAWVLKTQTVPSPLPPGWALRDFGSYAVL